MHPEVLNMPEGVLIVLHRGPHEPNEIGFSGLVENMAIDLTNVTVRPAPVVTAVATPSEPEPVPCIRRF